MTQQNGNAANLSSKIETEISQVWRQIGIMYQQLSNSAEMLQRLQQQTEAYVNGSLKTIGGMEGKVNFNDLMMLSRQALVRPFATRWRC